MNIHSVLKAAPFAASMLGCSVYAGGGGGGGGSGGSAGAEEIGALFEVVGVTHTLMSPPVDPSVTIPAGAMTPALDVYPGDMVTVSIPFNTPTGNVTAVGISFGPDAPVQVVPVPDALGMTEGDAQLQFHVPASVCDDLSAICHQIECYEFAVTDIGTVSAANIHDIVVVCNDCDEPSCQDLIAMCVVAPACESFAARFTECDPEYADYALYSCSSYVADGAMYHGAACGTAMEEYYVCLSQLSCGELVDFDQECLPELMATDPVCQ